MAGVVAVGVGSVLAQSDVIAERRHTMKGVAQATGDPVKMLKGQEPFDLGKVQAALKTYVEAAKKMPTLFPDNAKEGGGTHALPIIWQQKSDFVTRFEKLGREAADAQTSIKDEVSFKAVFPALLKNCGDCHQTYRAPLS